MGTTQAIPDDAQAVFVVRLAKQWSDNGQGTLKANAEHYADAYALKSTQRRNMDEIIERSEANQNARR
tara:strand:+ start:394 stop:597 length:204 start_codon:yes stop_codon:yes gene_type:complete